MFLVCQELTRTLIKVDSQTKFVKVIKLICFETLDHLGM